MEQMFEIDQARPEDAAQLLAYLKRVGSETDNLTFGAEGLPGTAEQEAAYLRPTCSMWCGIAAPLWPMAVSTGFPAE